MNILKIMNDYISLKSTRSYEINKTSIRSIEV